MKIENYAEFFGWWKVSTFLVGVMWLLWGAFHYQISDWDVGVSLTMAGVTFLAAEWCAKTLYSLNWRRFPLVIWWTWLAVDGVYVAYHTLAGNQMLRDAQWPASLCLFYLCGFIWLLGRKWHGGLLFWKKACHP
ncbi:hypothetical protein [Chitiniphilus eburneus]|uniref:Uncharacterized protein n=1 Tax=Chitiniphilus eburneus TaxID=2571148 RepID=A0A4U0P978_9NEIS|nr:hypothetical protein [Chitiniphilus eburneus]TJZ64141.1 hypothetical protein FAZ21_19385 [Chitiniphilus eburneus]